VADVSRATSFYYAFLALPRRQREAIIAVWDFCRIVDDEVDEPGDRSVEEQRAALAGWRAEIDRCYGGEAATPQGRALQPWIAEFQLTRAPFDDLIDGVEMDLDRTRYETFGALQEYCWRVASTVGLICIEIFGQRSAAAREYAWHLGIALQLTNIIRDVGADLERDRVYLPQDELRRFGCTDDDLKARRISAPVRELLAFQSARAREYYDRASALLAELEPRPLVAAEIMARIYRETLARIEAAGYDVFSERIRVPKGRRVAIAASTWFETRLGRHVPA
jgi:15-cis-phytoene synthase